MFKSKKKCQLFGVSPVLPVDDIVATVAYYKNQLGFAGDDVSGNPPSHGSVSRDRVGIQFTLAPNDYTSSDYPGWTYIFVEDIDTLFAEYQAKGIGILRELTDQPHGMREFEIRDVNGYRLRFGQYLSG